MSERILIERTYGSPEAAIIQPERQVAVTAYNIDRWLPRLGVQRWALVQVLRRLALDAPQAPDGTRRLTLTRDELAGRLGIVWSGTVGDWLKSEPIPGGRGWRRIAPSDAASEALAEFIPRLRYTYTREGGKTRRTGLALYVRMDEPLTPEDEARLPEVAVTLRQARLEQFPLEEVSPSVKVENPTLHPEKAPAHSSVKSENPISHSSVKSGIPISHPPVKMENPILQGCEIGKPYCNVNELTNRYLFLEKEIQAIDLTFTDGRRIRGRLTPIVKATEEALEDYHSTRMLYKVLLALYRAQRLDLFLQALRVAVEVGEMDAAANLGAVFVAELKRLGLEEGVDIGLAIGAGEEGRRGEGEKGTRGQGEEGGDAQALWEVALKDIALQVPRETFERLLAGTHVTGYAPAVDGDGAERFTIRARNGYAADWLTHRLASVVVRTLSRLTGRPAQVEFTAGD